MPTDFAATTGTDPLTTLAEAMDAAVDAARDGAGRARIRLVEIVPAAGRLVSRAVYRASYAVSFGVVFPAVILARKIPRGNAIVHGLVDGAQAAMDAVPHRSAPEAR